MREISGCYFVSDSNGPSMFTDCTVPPTFILHVVILWPLLEVIAGWKGTVHFPRIITTIKYIRYNWRLLLSNWNCNMRCLYWIVSNYFAGIFMKYFPCWRPWSVHQTLVNLPYYPMEVTMEDQRALVCFLAWIAIYNRRHLYWNVIVGKQSTKSLGSTHDPQANLQGGPEVSKEC